MIQATGTFEVQLTPQEDTGAPAGRMIIAKTYLGEMAGTGTGQMISKRIENGVAVYYAIEEFADSLNGKSGGFTLIHRGFMSSESQSLDITILEGSGTDELESVSGRMLITQDADGHRYELSFEL
jgi:hypothetical protein